ncbi:hypothetical protein HHK36_006182 [Tetracentron sinense]|uniref:D-isomer specific 2-hydroxyacid dehydrogenase catalytic domain-containing protein n=1 Tax=Tetracentron sinense TaxID=13715 RepID=A0A835DNV2_TETSI|nr:hypothetical protein HHK36_006182 [Tetracentron sinense]
MESIGVLMVYPVSTYLEEELNKRFKLFRIWEFPKKEFLKENSNSNSIRAIVGNGKAGVDSDMIDSLPKLEIISNHGVGMDKIDLVKCKEKGIRVTYTPDVLTEDVADLAIGLILATLRKICECDRTLYVLLILLDGLAALKEYPGGYRMLLEIDGLCAPV